MTDAGAAKPRSVLRDRFLYGTLLLGGVLGLLWADQSLGSSWGFIALVLLFGVVSWIELTGILAVKWRWARGIGAFVVGGAILAEWWAHRAPDAAASSLAELDVVLAAPFIFLVLLLLGAFRGPLVADRASELARALLGFIYLAVPLAFLVRLRLQHTEMWIFFTVLVVKGNDIGAFLTGRFLGRTPLTRISPKKTVEGMLGGLALGVIVALSYWGMTDLFAEGSAWRAIVVGVVTGFAGQVGDLAESFFKRAFGVKDSGALVPAFGGTLDMLDSVLFGAPVVYAFATWW